MPNAQCLQQLCHDEADIRKLPPSCFALSAQSLDSRGIRFQEK